MFFRSFRVQVVLALSAAAITTSCATSTVTAPAAPQLGETFLGVWTNVVSQYFNWWVIEKDRATNYGITLAGGRCSASEASVIGQRQIDVPFGNAGPVEMKISDQLLMFETPRGVARHRRVDKSDICRKPDGTYFKGAPFPRD